MKYKKKVGLKLFTKKFTEVRAIQFRGNDTGDGNYEQIGPYVDGWVDTDSPYLLYGQHVTGLPWRRG